MLYYVHHNGWELKYLLQANKQLQSSAAEAFDTEWWQLFSNKNNLFGLRKLYRYGVRVMKNIINSGQRSACSVEKARKRPQKIFEIPNFIFWWTGQLSRFNSQGTSHAYAR